MTTSETAEIRELIARTFETEFGGRATVREVREAVVTSAPDHLADYIARRGWTSSINAYFRQKGVDGLPEAPVVDDAGTHVQRPLMDVGEYRYAIRRRIDLGDQSYRSARALADECYFVHGIRIAVVDESEAVAL